MRFYVWLTYRIGYLKKPTLIPWWSPQAQFGTYYARPLGISSARSWNTSDLSFGSIRPSAFGRPTPDCVSTPLRPTFRLECADRSEVALYEAPRPEYFDSLVARRREHPFVSADDDSAVGPEGAGKELVIGGVAHDCLAE